MRQEPPCEGDGTEGQAERGSERGGVAPGDGADPRSTADDEDPDVHEAAGEERGGDDERRLLDPGRWAHRGLRGCCRRSGGRGTDARGGHVPCACAGVDRSVVGGDSDRNARIPNSTAVDKPMTWTACPRATAAPCSPEMLSIPVGLTRNPISTNGPRALASKLAHLRRSCLTMTAPTPRAMPAKVRKLGRWPTIVAPPSPELPRRSFSNRIVNMMNDTRSGRLRT